MHYNLIGGLLLLLFSLPLGCETQPEPAQLEEAISTIEAPIKGGYIDDVDTAVVGVVTLSGFGGVGACSGTLIAPNVVLTAQHCVAPIQGEQEGINCATSEFGSPHNASNLYVTTKASMSYEPGDYHGAISIILPEGGFGESFGETSLVCGRDMALVILTNPIPASEATPMIPRVDTPLVANEIYSAIGYGATGGSGGGSGTRRRRDNLYVSCVDDCPSFYVKEAEFVGDTGVCQGDSGGPAVDAAFRVVGVASRGGQGCSSPVYGYVYGWADWVKDIVEQATTIAGIEPPKWVYGWPTHPDYSHPVGNACDGPENCPGDLCLDGYCTRRCNGDSPCDDPYYCGPNTGLCTLIPVGASCDVGEDCAGGICIDGLCSRTCHDNALCPAGYDCSDDGVCELVEMGSACETDDECEPQAICIQGLCTRACTEDAPCPHGFGCMENGICGPYELGGGCEQNTDCLSGQCQDGACTAICGDDAPCPDGFFCGQADGLCELLPVGEYCLQTEDCLPGAICSDEFICTRICDAQIACPDGYHCNSLSGICTLPPIGAPCETGDDCLTGLCFEGYCTRTCSAVELCPIYFECSGDPGICEMNADSLIDDSASQGGSGENSRGGCSSHHTRTGFTGLLAMLLLLSVSLVWRRRYAPVTPSHS